MQDGVSDETRAARAIIDRYERPLIAYATRITGCAEQARDVVQETFLRFFSNGATHGVESDGAGIPADVTRVADGPRGVGNDAGTAPGVGRDAGCLRGIERVAPWLFKVCRSRALDARRRDKRMSTLTAEGRAPAGRDGSVGSAGAKLPGIPASTPLAMLEAEESREQVLALLATLPERQQEVVRLRFQGGLRYREIGEVLDLTETNVGYLLHVALKSIRDRLPA